MKGPPRAQHDVAGAMGPEASLPRPDPSRPSPYRAVPPTPRRNSVNSSTNGTPWCASVR